MTEAEKNLIESWILRYKQIFQTMKEIEEEKEANNYPVVQSTEDLMFLTAKSTEFTINALEYSLED